MQACNTHSCVGDEVCIAQQDLIIALDASASLTESGFKVLRRFAKSLVGRYRGTYFGLEAMRVGVVLFGNGQMEVMPDGTSVVSSAIIVQDLTADMSVVQEKIEALQWQKGFTNTAQALTLADTMLQRGRTTAQSAVLLLSGGKYIFEFQTSQKAKELKSKNIKLFVAPVTQVAGPELDVFRHWASPPHDVNFERLDGLDAVEHDVDAFAQRLVVKFCPDAVSMEALKQKEQDRGYALIRESGYPSSGCARRHYVGVLTAREQCAEAALERGHLAFSFGTGHRRGRCYALELELPPGSWTSWQEDRRKMECPGGSWLYSPFDDTYAIKPQE